MHKGDGVILQDAGSVVDSIVHMSNEKTGEVIDSRHQSSNRVMEKLVVREFLIRSVLV